MKNKKIAIQFHLQLKFDAIPDSHPFGERAIPAATYSPLGVGLSEDKRVGG